MKNPRLLLRLIALFFAPIAWTSAAPGDVDLDLPDLQISAGDRGLVAAVQPDGKIIIAGEFTSVLGVPRQHIARINANGTLDLGFDPKANFPGVRCVAVQADGKVLIGGAFTTLQPNGAPSPIARSYIARFNADGTFDAGFNPNPNSTVGCIAVQADGKVLLGGSFTEFQPNGAGKVTSRLRIARVNADGTLDTVFDPSANNAVYSLAVQADGKVLLGGEFTTLRPNGTTTITARNRVARVDTNGMLDTGFDPKAMGGSVLSVAIQANGKVLLGGTFVSLQPNGAATVTPRSRIARVNEDGTLDPDFDPSADGGVSSMAVQADGRVLLGGSFTSLQPNGAASPTTRNRLARLNDDGTLDADFDSNADSIVSGVAMQADGKVLVGGFFQTLQPNGAASPILRRKFVRLANDPATQTLSASNHMQVVWTRGGAAPELSPVTFELSTDGGATWTPLGAGIRIGNTANWQRTGLTLPASGSLRARGVTTGGYRNGSSGLIEQVSLFDTTPYGQWKLAQLGAVNAPDTGNPDADAYENLAEYGLVLSPTAFSAGPVGERFSYPEGDRLRIVFTRDPARNDVTIEVLAADDPAGPWTPIASSVLGAVTTGVGYYGGDSAEPGLKAVEVRDLYNVDDPAHPRRFLRLRVSR